MKIVAQQPVETRAASAISAPRRRDCRSRPVIALPGARAATGTTTIADTAGAAPPTWAGHRRGQNRGTSDSSDGRRADDREADLDLYDPLEDTYYDFIEKKPKRP